MSPADLTARPSGRVRATPYARRLARERNLPLAAIAGSGPNGRITSDDLRNFVPQVAGAATAPATASETPAPAHQIAAAAPATAAVAAPAAIVAGVEFGALEQLLRQVATVRPGVTREDICLKAAAVALAATPSIGDPDALLLLSSPGRRQRLAGLANASVGAVATIRERADDAGGANLAMSFISRPGIRPAAAQLVGGASARLVVGAPDGNGAADCLLSYDPTKIGDEAAENFLATFRDLVETPFRLLV